MVYLLNEHNNHRQSIYFFRTIKQKLKIEITTFLIVKCLKNIHEDKSIDSQKISFNLQFLIVDSSLSLEKSYQLNFIFKKSLHIFIKSRSRRRTQKQLKPNARMLHFVRWKNRAEKSLPSAWLWALRARIAFRAASRGRDPRQSTRVAKEVRPLLLLLLLPARKGATYKGCTG